MMNMVRQGSDALSKRLSYLEWGETDENRDGILAMRYLKPMPKKVVSSRQGQNGAAPKPISRFSDADEEPMTPKHKSRKKSTLTSLDTDSDKCRVTDMPSKHGCPKDRQASLEEKIKMHVGALQTKDVPARYGAAEALAALGPQARLARCALEQALQTDTSVHVRKSAALALGELGDQDAEASLREALRHDDDKFVCQRAQQALDMLFQKGVAI